MLMDVVTIIFIIMLFLFMFLGGIYMIGQDNKELRQAGAGMFYATIIAMALVVIFG